MRYFEKIRDNIPVADTLAQLDAHPELWDAHPWRTDGATPFTRTSDIWIRYNEVSKLAKIGRHAFNAEHWPVWYPAWHALPALRPIVFGAMADVQAEMLGGILITRIPPGGRVLPHVDAAWHASYYNLKVYIPLRANDRCINRCEDESVVIRAGECVTFNNLVVHSVENNGESERITLIICMHKSEDI